MNDMPVHDPATGEIIEHAPPTDLGITPQAIIQARLAVMRAATGVGKSGRNTFHGYNYASDEDVLGLIQPLMAENGLLLEMRPIRVEFDEHKNAKVTFDMVWMHESGVVAPAIPWYGIASDCDKQGRLQDKWFNKAATAAEKYFLLKQFHIPAGKNSDPDASDDKTGPADAKPRRQQSKPPDIEEIDRQREEMDQQYADTVAKPREVMSNEPHMIPLPAGPAKEAWTRWTNRFLLAVSTAETVAAVDQWVLSNDDHITGLQGFNETWHKALKDKVKGHRDAIAGKEP